MGPAPKPPVEVTPPGQEPEGDAPAEAVLQAAPRLGVCGILGKPGVGHLAHGRVVSEILGGYQGPVAARLTDERDLRKQQAERGKHGRVDPGAIGPHPHEREKAGEGLVAARAHACRTAERGAQERPQVLHHHVGAHLDGSAQVGAGPLVNHDAQHVRVALLAQPGTQAWGLDAPFARVEGKRAAHLQARAGLRVTKKHPARRLSSEQGAGFCKLETCQDIRGIRARARKRGEVAVRMQASQDRPTSRGRRWQPRPGCRRGWRKPAAEPRERRRRSRRSRRAPRR